MRTADAAKERLFRKMKAGDSTAAYDLLESERAELYDYLMRMTGQITRSVDTVDEVYQTLTADFLATIATYPGLKVCLFSTARRFNADIWNADTARLANSALELESGSGSKPLKQAGADRDGLDGDHSKAVDRALRTIPGRQREAVLLRWRHGFDEGESGEIMGVSDQEARSLAVAGLRLFATDCPEADGEHESAIARHPGHPAPLRSSHMKMNLSEVMQGIKTSPVGLRSPLRITVLILLVIGAAVWRFYPKAIGSTLAFLKALIAN
jgi:DNA-directed RNA polymerase specialized sigma24 family protein